MSGTANNLPPVPGNWLPGNDYTAYLPSNNAWSRPSMAPRTPSYSPGFSREGGEIYSSASNRLPVTDFRRQGGWNRPPPPPRSIPYSPHEMNGGAQDPWRLFEDRVRTGPYGLNGFPSHPLSPMRIVVLGEETAPEVNPRLRQFIQDSPPRIRNQWNMPPPAAEEEESRLTREEQKKALKKLKKQVYNPYPKNKNKTWCLYYRDRKQEEEKDEDDDDEGKSCAICLEDFVPRQEVLVTPCNHMFHEDCIVPWVKSNGQCPVCRFALGEKRRGTATAAVPPNAHLGANDVMAVDLISLIRAMEEAFEWVQVPR